LVDTFLLTHGPFHFTSTQKNVHSIVYANGQMTDLGTLGGASSFPAAINDMGQIVGAAFPPGNPTDPQFAPLLTIHAFLYSGGVMTDLGAAGGTLSSGATGINNSGKVVGTLNLPNGNSHGFIYSNGVLQELLTPPADLIGLSGINNQNLVVGQYLAEGSNVVQAFTYDAAHTINFLGTLGGSGSFAIAANDAGKVVGASLVPSAPEEVFHAFLYQGSGLIDLGTLPNQTSSEAHDINAAGQIVGISFHVDLGTPRGFLYSNGVMYDLNSLIPADSGWEIMNATSINDLGQIVGQGVRNGQYHAVLLTTPAVSISNLASLVRSFNLPFGIASSLLVKLQQALAAANAGDQATTCNLLEAFTNQVRALQMSHQISFAQASQLFAAVNELRAALGCL
jgi:probable HAF family extracellular repeat protein